MKKEPKWIATAHLNYEFFTFSAAARSLQREMSKIVGLPFNYKYENMDVFYDQNNIDGHVQNLRAFPALIERQIKFIKDQVTALQRVSRKLGNKEDLKSFVQWYKTFRTFLPTFGLVLGLESALEEKLRVFLSAEKLYEIAFAAETASAFEQREHC